MACTTSCKENAEKPSAPIYRRNVTLPGLFPFAIFLAIYPVAFLLLILILRLTLLPLRQMTLGREPGIDWWLVERQIRPAVEGAAWQREYAQEAPVRTRKLRHSGIYDDEKMIADLTAWMVE